MHLTEDLSEIKVTVAEVMEKTDRVNKFPGQDGEDEKFKLRMSEVLLRMNLIF